MARDAEGVIGTRGIDFYRLRAFHAGLVRDEAALLPHRTPREIAAACEAVLEDAGSFFEAHAGEIDGGDYGSYARFTEVYGEALRRFRSVLVESFALDREDPGGLFASAETAVRRGLPFLEDPRSYALRALVGRPPFDPPGPLARRLLDLRVELADLERWKQKEFLAAWKVWGRRVWALDHHASQIFEALGEKIPPQEIAFVPFDERLRRLDEARTRYRARL